MSFIFADSAGGGGAGASFTIFQVDAGTNPVATGPSDTLTLTSSDGSILISGDSLTDTIDFTVVGGGGGIGGTTGATDNSVLRADGTGGSTLQTSTALIDDSGNFSVANGSTITVGNDANRVGMQRSVNNLQLFADGLTGFPAIRINSNANLTFGNVLEVNYTTDILAFNYFNPNASTFNFYGSPAENVIYNGISYPGNFGTGGAYIRPGNQIGGVGAFAAPRFEVQIGSNNSNDPGATAGMLNLFSGDMINPTAVAAAGPVNIRGGSNSGSGDGGAINIHEGGSAGGNPGLITIGATSGVSRIRFNSRTQSAAAVGLTLTNGPTGTSGNPAIWLRININGTDYVIPGWAI